MTFVRNAKGKAGGLNTRRRHIGRRVTFAMVPANGHPNIVGKTNCVTAKRNETFRVDVRKPRHVVDIHHGRLVVFGQFRL